MEYKKSVRLRELLKDILIVLLALSALFLALRPQLASGGFLGGLARTLSGQRGTQTKGGAAAALPVYPARIVVTGVELDRHGAQYDSAVSDALFSDTFSVFGEALSAASQPQPVSETYWQKALSTQPGIYFDFLGRYPLSALLSWLEPGSGSSTLTGSARRIALADDGGGNAVLCYQDPSDGRCYACQTSGAVYTHLLASINATGGGRPQYAFERRDTQVFQALDPYVLLTGQSPAPPVYQATDPLGTQESAQSVWALLSSMSALKFRNQANSPYRPNPQDWVLIDGQDQLRLSAGTITFHSGGEGAPRYPVSHAAEQPTATELLDAVLPIAAGTVGQRCGDARLYLIGLESLPDGGWQADFGYSLNGTPVRLSNQEYAARFIIQNDEVSDYTLRFRHYAATGETSAVLPELQAAAALAALETGQQELTLCYEDSGGERLTADWFAR